MFKQFTIDNKLSSTQKNLISSVVTDVSNLQLLKSEEAIKSVLASYADKFKNVGKKITDAANSHAKTKEKIDVGFFNELFNDLYIDLKSLYTQISYVDEILALNLSRNKKFFAVLKKKIRDLSNKLYITRMNISDSSNYDEIYYESFSDTQSQNLYNNITLNKKTNFISLVPRSFFIQNKKYMIKNVSSQTFPVDNKDGGVIHTTNNLNTFEYNYGEESLRDMLQNGLWKEEIYCKDLPEIAYNIGDNTNIMLKRFIGVVSIVDIEYTNPVDINSFDIDLFGEHPILLVAILYKDADGVMRSFKKPQNYLDINNIVTVDSLKSLVSFDLLSIRNLTLTKTNFVRLVFNQTYYNLLDSSELTTSSLAGDLNKDLSERRYEMVKLNGGNDDDPAIPTDKDVSSVYSKITSVIESTRSIEETLRQIMDILDPPIKLMSIDFSKTLKFELGAWSIDPSVQKYQGVGKYESGDYLFKDKSLILASLTTSQDVPMETTCNWYISNKQYDYNVPILESKENLRKEPINFITSDHFKDLGWTDAGSIFVLDFPIDQTTNQFTTIYENGIPIPLIYYDYFFFNSTMIYLGGIKDPKKNNYVISYTPSSYSSVNVYTLEQTGTDTGINLQFNVMSVRRSLLNLFLNMINKTNIYTIKINRITKEEYNDIFFNRSFFISTDLNSTLDSSYDIFDKHVTSTRGTLVYSSDIVDLIYRDLTYTHVTVSCPPISQNRFL